MEKKAIHKYLRISSKKLRLRIDQLKGQQTVTVMEELELEGGKQARLLFKALKNCLSQYKPDQTEQVYIKNIIVNKGPSFKRWRPGSRGMAKPYTKYTAHLEVVLELPEPAKKNKKNGK